MNNTPSRANRRQAGFTLVELLVVIAIIGMLMGLLIPAVSSARATARKATCLQQVRQLAMGVVNYHSNKQKYPGYVQSLPRNNNQYLVIGGSSMSDAGFASVDANLSDSSLISWAAVILPQMDRNDIYDVMVDANAPSAQSGIRPIEFYVCPDDTEITSLPDNAGLTYVVNTGAWDWYDMSGNVASPFNRAVYTAIPGDSKANGVFHNRTLGNVRVREIKDGLTNTLMLSENIHKETDPSAVGFHTWAGVSAGAGGEKQLGMVWVESGDLSDQVPDNPFLDPDGDFQNPSSHPDQFPFSVEGDTADYQPGQPRYARPASAHPQGAFNCGMMDGSARSIAADIDYSVYQRLLTPEGRKAVRPWDGAPASSYLNLPVLSENDF